MDSSVAAKWIASKRVVVHPIVLLSVADHYNRQAKGTQKRVLGTLLGEVTGNVIHITNSFAVPFEEDSKDPLVWYFDHNYHENLFLMFKKVKANEKILGWYSTGTKCRSTDLDIHEIYRKYCPQPIYLTVDTNPQPTGLPTEAYISVEVPTTNSAFRRTFVKCNVSMGAYEAEEVGLEHLLRDVQNPSTSVLAIKVGDKIKALETLSKMLTDISEYLQIVINGKIALNPSILYNLQVSLRIKGSHIALQGVPLIVDLFNMMPSLDSEEVSKAFTIELNDAFLSIYTASISRAVMALHDLIRNKTQIQTKK